jgi:hypothetical protein
MDELAKDQSVIMVSTFNTDDLTAVTIIGQKVSAFISSGEWRVAFEQTNALQNGGSIGVLHFIRFERIVSKPAKKK